MWRPVAIAPLGTLPEPGEPNRDPRTAALPIGGERFARALAAELDQVAAAERAATAIDRGIGVAAMAALLATPAGPARAVEAARWAERAAAAVDQVAVVVLPGAGADWIDAHTELMLALRRFA